MDRRALLTAAVAVPMATLPISVMDSSLSPVAYKFAKVVLDPELSPYWIIGIPAHIKVFRELVAAGLMREKYGVVPDDKYRRDVGSYFETIRSA